MDETRGDLARGARAESLGDDPPPLKLRSASRCSVASSMAELRPGYPHGLADDELRQQVDELVEVASIGTSGDVLALIELGLGELARREAERAARWARRVAWVSLLVAGAALALALVFGLLDYFGDAGWQDDQNRLLTEIRDRLR
jgi:hypothetical protein